MNILIEIKNNEKMPRNKEIIIRFNLSNMEEMKKKEALDQTKFHFQHLFICFYKKASWEKIRKTTKL